MSEIELLPCPFCSGKVEIRQKGHGSYYGGCVNGCFISSSEYDKNALAKQLNTRKPIQEIVERLEEEKKNNIDWLTIESLYYDGKVVGLEDAIEICKEVGRTNE